MLVYNFITQLYITIILHKLGEAQIYYIYNWHFSLFIKRRNEWILKKAHLSKALGLNIDI